MKVEVINRNLILDIYGFSGKAVNKDYAGTAFRLMDKMWQTVKGNNLKNKGLNVWVYDEDDNVFAGVELEENPPANTELEKKTIALTNYGYYKHIGPYHLIKAAGQNMREELAKEGYNIVLPYIEIYGHWNSDETKLETELLMALR